MNNYASIRDKIIFGEDYDKSKYFEGKRRFSITIEKIDKLLMAHLINRNDKMPGFVLSHESNGWYVSGFTEAVSTCFDNNCGVVFDGIMKENPTSAELLDFDVFKKEDGVYIAEDGFCCFLGKTDFKMTNPIVGISLEALYKMEGQSKNNVILDTEVTNGISKKFYYLYNENVELACCDGEAVEVISHNKNEWILKNSYGDNDVYFTLTDIEFETTHFKEWGVSE